MNKISGESKESFFENSDPCLKAFIKGATRNLSYKNKHHSNINELYQVLEDLIKCCNAHFTSPIRVGEHQVNFVSSNQSDIASQVFSKQGAKGSRPIFTKVMKNTEKANAFKAPKQMTLFISFDNIQKIFKSHRVGSSDEF